MFIQSLRFGSSPANYPRGGVCEYSAGQLMARGKPLADRDVPCVQMLQGHYGAMACCGPQCAVRVLGAELCD